jgi:hypothetical protein
MQDKKYCTTKEGMLQGKGTQDDWEKEVVPREPSQAEEQAKKRHPHLSGVGRSAQAWIDCGGCSPPCPSRIRSSIEGVFSGLIG